MDIIKVPHKILHQKAKKVKKFDNNLQIIIEQMIKTMRENKGVGIAAPQIGKLLSVIAVEFEDSLYVMVNPKTAKPSVIETKGIEGCLSIPNLYGNVSRPFSITVSGLDRFGKPIVMRVQGMLGRIFQHEIDHTNGILFTDKAEFVWVSEKNPVL